MTTAATQAGDRESEDVALVPFARSHLEGALKLSQEMSWPYLLKDWEFALQLGRGFVVTSAGAVVGTALWWPYGDTHASAGMIIVSKAVQGRGYGARLMDALLAAARPRVITLNSTAEGMELYRRRGFVSVGAMTPSDCEAITHLDRQATGWTRREMLNRLIEAGDGYVLLRDGIPSGYA